MTSASFVIFCKSYRGDFRRVQRLLESLQKFNVDQIPVVISTPHSDRELFAPMLKQFRSEWLSDEDIVSAHPLCDTQKLLNRYRLSPGGLSQQLVKSEAWRLLQTDVYLCIDSDSTFYRPFFRNDFFHGDGNPYVIMHQGKETMQLALMRGHTEIFDGFLRESRALAHEFDRTGLDYDFGPSPYIWSRAVWRDLDEKKLQSLGSDQTLWDAIQRHPTECRWYGEALLAYQSIGIRPIEPLFRVYHHAWQYKLYKQLGETRTQVAQQYLGAILQSNWEYEMDAKGSRSWASLLLRKIKRGLKQ